MYVRLIYYSGDRSLIESVWKKESEGITGDRTFFLDAVDNDGDALRFQHNNGGHFDVIFMYADCAQAVYDEILEAAREGENLLEMDIRGDQVTEPAG